MITEIIIFRQNTPQNNSVGKDELLNLRDTMIVTFLNRITDVGEAYLHTIMVRYWHSNRRYDIVKEPLGKLGKTFSL